MPALLDYAYGTRNFVTESCLIWEGLPGDHALCAYTCRPSFVVSRHPKRKWEPVSFEVCLDRMSQVHVFEGMSATALHAQLLQVQSECADSRSCQQKRYDRMPQELRDVYSRLAIETDEYQIVALRAEVWKLRKEWVAHARVQTLTEKVKNGSVLHRSKKLHTISSFVVHGQRTVDQDVWKTELKNYFDKKWGVFDFQMRCNVVFWG